MTPFTLVMVKSTHKVPNSLKKMTVKTAQLATLYSTVKTTSRQQQASCSLLLHQSFKDKFAKELVIAYEGLQAKDLRTDNKPGGHELTGRPPYNREKAQNAFF